MEQDILINNKAIANSESFIHKLFREQLSPQNLYHNLSHTHRVKEKAEELAEAEYRSDEDLYVLKLAVLFHDAGYIEKDEGHEEVSVEIARKFLTEEGLEPDVIAKVEELIIATKTSHKPQNTLEKIIKDADSSHLASEKFFEISGLLQKELSLKKDEEISDVSWLDQNIEFFQNHEFYTNTAIKEWLPVKDLNLYEIHQRKEKAEKKATKPIKLGRGIETMYRVTLKNHIELSAIADTKANILLSVNAIIISIALSSLIPKLDSFSNQYLVWPTFILLIFSVASIIMSIISTRPKVSNITVTRDMIKNKQTNILFFGNFYKMNIDDFEWGMDYLINNEDALYNSLTKDLYYLGMVLERKYRLLRITYNIFMFGIVVSAISFVISYLKFAEIT